MSEAASATDVAALDVGHADDGDAQEHGARGASPAAASSGASSGASPRAGLGVRRRDNSEASTSPMRSTASGSHGSRSPSQGPPSDALTTAHLVLQQWSALTEKPAVGIRDEVNGGEDVEDDDEDDDDDEEDEEGDIGGGRGRRYANGDAPRPASGPSSGTGNPSNKTFLICTVLSIQYMKLLVLMGLALPVSGVLVSDTFPQSFEAFYMYLYLGTRGIRYRLRLLRRSRAVETVRYGSVYLRLAMNAFGIGNMIYCCLEVAHGVVKYQHYHCDQAEQQVRILLPACRAVLTLAQMHFMLFNNKASEIRRHRCVSRFGLAHMIATNICEWLSVVVEETRHEIAELSAGGHVLADHDELGGLAGRNYSSFDLNSTRPTTRPDCESAGGDSGGSPEQDVLGNLLQGSGPFLFPCTIEYSLICAVILFEMWIHQAKSDDEGSASRMGSRLDLSTDSRSSRVADPTGPPSASAVDQVTVEPVQDKLQQDSDDGAGSVPWRTPLHLSVDLTHSQRGMFLGIVLLVATIMSLVLFFALGEADGYQRAAHALVSYVEGSLHVAVILGVGLAAFGMRRLGSDNGQRGGSEAGRAIGKDLAGRPVFM
ncbi:hypothetical protein ONE63_009638 [Megalurothrips usitatus]|uniref:Proton channel OtopLc-like n=1 Tax=Megalurothrips usitatus TaxID=439358 RepID=A0AAV7XFB0_9NEOP|nr:hypothetical protein ONE63_009638 [Megalurothrips usitatus]